MDSDTYQSFSSSGVAHPTHEGMLQDLSRQGGLAPPGLTWVPESAPLGAHALADWVPPSPTTPMDAAQTGTTVSYLHRPHWQPQSYSAPPAVRPSSDYFSLPKPAYPDAYSPAGGYPSPTLSGPSYSPAFSPSLYALPQQFSHQPSYLFASSGYDYGHLHQPVQQSHSYQHQQQQQEEQQQQHPANARSRLPSRPALSQRSLSHSHSHSHSLSAAELSPPPRTSVLKPSISATIDPIDHLENLKTLSAEANKGCTPFISKLCKLIQEPELDSVIRWSRKGDTLLFVEKAPALLSAFAREFRHSSSPSFIRQLNIYGFNRVPTRKLDPADVRDMCQSEGLAAFSHPKFYRDTPADVCDVAALKPRLPGKKDASPYAKTAKSKN